MKARGPLLSQKYACIRIGLGSGTDQVFKMNTI